MNDIGLIHVTDVEYIADYTMILTFSDGARRRIDFLPLLRGKIFEPLKEPANFTQFGLTHWTIEWYNGADFAPEYLHEQGVAV